MNVIPPHHRLSVLSRIVHHPEWSKQVIRRSTTRPREANEARERCGPLLTREVCCFASAVPNPRPGHPYSEEERSLDTISRRTSDGYLEHEQRNHECEMRPREEQ
jgi:hypothetical protein